MKSMWVEMRKVVLSPYFLVGVLVFAGMCFTSNVAYDIHTGEEYTVFDMILRVFRGDPPDENFAEELMMVHAFSGWLVQFVGIIVAFPFVRVLCDERRSTAKRLCIYRTGVFRYTLDKFVVALCSSALVAAVGYLLFAGIVMTIFPSATQLGSPLAESYSDAYLWKEVLSVALVGMSAGVLPLVIAAFTDDKYFCICLPVLVQYAHSVASQKMWYRYWEEGVWEPERERWLHLLEVNNIENIVWYEELRMFLIGIYVVILVAVFVLVYLRNRRSVDNGA